jgi:hypothetical protein
LHAWNITVPASVCLPFTASAAAASGMRTVVSPSHTMSGSGSKLSVTIFGFGYRGAAGVTPPAPASFTSVAMAFSFAAGFALTCQSFAMRSTSTASALPPAEISTGAAEVFIISAGGGTSPN